MLAPRRQVKYSGKEHNFAIAYCTIVAVMLSRQHQSTRAGADPIQLIYSGHAIRAMSDVTRQFCCQTIFWQESTPTDKSS